MWQTSGRWGKIDRDNAVNTMINSAYSGLSIFDRLITEAIFRVTTAIFHLGNIEFTKGKEVDSSVLKYDKAKFHLRMTTKLRCDPMGLEDALCKRVMITPEEIIIRSLDPLSATVSRDRFLKTIYSRLFDWLVENLMSLLDKIVPLKI